MLENVLFVFLLYSEVARAAEYFGGSMSFNFLDGGKKLNVKIRTGWVLGKGPCGPNCGKSAVNMDTDNIRQNSLTSNGVYYFGKWNLLTVKQTFPNRDITSDVNNNIHEHVVAVSERLGWELDVGEVNITLPREETTTITYIGNHWAPITLQHDIQSWHMEILAMSHKRDDTQMPNRSPEMQMKPFYRLGLNRNYTLHIPVIDQDGDAVECRIAKFVESVDLYRAGLPPHSTINKDCSVDIYTSPTEYSENDTAGFALSVEDYNTERIFLSNDSHPDRLPYGSPLSTVPVQFFIAIGKTADEPVFVLPTPPANFHYELNVGADLKLAMFAEPAVSSRTIEEFFFTRTDGRPVQVTPIGDSPGIGKLVRNVTAFWTPTKEEVGEHILCARVQDSDGFEAVDMRCVIVKIKPSFAVKGQIVQGKPSFLYFPKDGEILCKSGANCKFPIYAVSDVPGGIKAISVESTDVKNIVGEALRDAPNYIAAGAKMIDIHFEDSSGGKKKICIRASDRKSSVLRCLIAHVINKDPCESRPCTNPEECVSDSTGYKCLCTEGFSGQKCEIAPDVCGRTVCKNGGTCESFGINTWCLCTSGYTGQYCENRLDECLPDPCDHGVCVQKLSAYECHCIDGYTGTTCGHPPSTSQSLCDGSTSKTGCTCNHCDEPNGMCIKLAKSSSTPSCLCSIGYHGNNCNNANGSPGNKTKPRFVPPTMETGTIVTCDAYQYSTEKCIFPLFVSTGVSTVNLSEITPLVTVIDLPENMKTPLLSNLKDPKIPGIRNTYQIDVTLQQKVVAKREEIICFEVSSQLNPSVAFDQKCFNVRFTDKSQPRGLVHTISKFESPTLPALSEITCQVGRMCHILVYTNKISHCENVGSSAPANVKVFPARPVDSFCVSDVVYDATSANVGNDTICLKSWTKANGESRCFILHLVLSTTDKCDPNPCFHGEMCTVKIASAECKCAPGYSGTQCDIGPCYPETPSFCGNGGYCHKNVTKTCICRLGYFGSKCNQASTEKIKDIADNGAKFMDGTIPTSVKCYINKPCYMSTALVGYPGVIPTVTAGYVDSHVDVIGISIKKDNYGNSSYHSVIEIVSKASGNQTVCLQSIDKQGMNGDEICFTVESLNGAGTPVTKYYPYFVYPTPLNGSSMECEVAKPCHLNLWTNNWKDRLECPNITSSLSSPLDVHIFQGSKYSRTSGCSADVFFSSKSQRTYNPVCFTVSSEYKARRMRDYGETRCYNVDIVAKLTSTGSCSAVKCLNGGFCDGHNLVPKCYCINGYSGRRCEVEKGTSLTNPKNDANMKYKFGDFAVPKNISCTINHVCPVQVSIIGQSNTIPFLQTVYSDNGITTTKPVLKGILKVRNGTYTAQINVISRTPGTHRVCLQTSSTPKTVDDQICFDVEVKSKATESFNTNQPHFDLSTITMNSTLQCVAGKFCHVIMVLSPGMFDNCPHVKQTNGSKENIHLFYSNNKSDIFGKCVLDVTLSPPVSNIGTKEHYCFELSLPSIPGETRCFFIENVAKIESSDTVCSVSDGKTSTMSADKIHEENVDIELLNHQPSNVEKVKSRAVWSRKTEYMLSLLGYTVGLGVVWRFPYLCMRNGGGAFLIPYIFFLVLCGFPLYVLEVAIGQFSGKSPLVIWCICPLLKGIGYSTVLIAFVFTWYYGLVIAWILIYLFYSFYPTHPWSTCDNSWNSKNCISSRSSDLLLNNTASHVNETALYLNKTVNLTTQSLNTTETSIKANYSFYPTAANEFWRFCVLNESKGLEDWGTIQWHIVIALFVGFATVFLCIIKGVKSVGKVAYVSAVAPYILIVTILVKSLTLEGSLDGVIFFLRPDFSKLLNFQVWIEAGLQVFYSLGPAWGSVITMASYNKFNNKCIRDAAIVSFMDLFSALLCGLVVFSITGFLANEAGMKITDIADAGPGLVFQAYPEALTRLPVPHIWAVLFFIMLFFVGLDTQFAMLETIISGLVDMFPQILGKRKTRLILLVFAVYMLSSLIFATQAGVYIFQIIDWYSSIFIIFITSFLECIIVGHLYGAERFSRDVEAMTGRPLPTFFRLSFCVLTPAAMIMSLVATLANYKHPQYKGYVYPQYIGALGMLIALVSVIPLPLIAGYQICLARGTLTQRIKKLIQPSKAWKPNDDLVKQDYEMYQYSDSPWLNLKCDIALKRR